MEGRRKRTLVVIPAYNESATIGHVLQGVQRHAPDCDLLVVNDGSRDGTDEVVKAAGVGQLILPCNLGYGAALQAGFRYAARSGYETAVLLDADGQHDPADIPRLLEAMRQRGADVVIASRFVHGGSYSGSVLCRLGMKFFSCVTWLLIGQRIYDTTSGFKALSESAYRLLLMGHFLDFHAECLVFWGKKGLRIEELPIVGRPRTGGRSMYSWLTLFNYPLKTLVLIVVGLLDIRTKGQIR